MSEYNNDVYDYGMRVSDSRTARFFSVDPLTKSYPELTPYQFASNTPIQAIDLDGLEAAVAIIPRDANVNTTDVIKGMTYQTPQSKQMLSLSLDFTPYVGTAKGIGEGIYGEDFVTGDKKAWWERALGLLPVVGAVRKGTNAMKAALAVEKTAEAVKAAEKVADASKTITKVVDCEKVANTATKATEGLANSGPIMRNLGAASRAEMLAKKLKMNINSPTTRQVLNSLDNTVESFVNNFRKASIKAELGEEYMKMTIEQALQSKNTTVRKLLIDSRFAK